MKRVDIRSAAVGVLLTLLATLLVSEALGQRPGQPGQRLGLQTSGPSGPYQITGGVASTGRQALYILDQGNGELYCLDTPQIVGTNSTWNVSYAGNVGQLVARARR